VTTISPDAEPSPEAEPLRGVWQLAWPNILSNLLVAIVGFAHIRVVAPLGTDAIAAVTTGHRVMFLLQALLMGISVGATALIARHWGARERAQAAEVASAALVVALAIALTMMIPALLVPAWIAGLFGLGADTTAAAASFIFWLGVFNLVFATSMTLAGTLRAIGDVFNPLWFLAVSSTLNVVFGYALAHGVGPLPAMGVAGVALGGGTASLLVTTVFLLTWLGGGFKLKAARHLPHFRATVRRLLSLATPAIMEQIVIQGAFLAFFALIARYGEVPYAAYGIGVSLLSFSMVIGFGFSLATATVVGQQLGAGQPDAAVASIRRSATLAAVAMSLLGGVAAVFAPALAGFMSSDADVVVLTVTFIYFFALLQPLMAVDFCLAGGLRGAGDTRYPLFATVSGLVFGRVLPTLLFYLLGLPVQWILAALLLDYGLTAVVLIRRYRSRRWLQLNPTHAAT